MLQGQNFKENKMFALFTENNETNGQEFFWKMHVEGVDKEECEQKIINYMKEMYGDYPNTADVDGLLYCSYNLDDRTVCVYDVSYFDTRESLVEELMQMTEVL